MYATYQIKADEMNFDLFQSIKNTFNGKDIEISVTDYNDSKSSNQTNQNIEILLKRINDVEEGKNLVIFSTEEFEKIL